MGKAGTVERVTFARRSPNPTVSNPAVSNAAVSESVVSESAVSNAAGESVLRWSTTAAIVFLVALTATACTGEDATPIVPGATTTGPTTPHQLEPTEQMRELAEKQCLDDPTLEQGVVNAVDPADEEQILSSVVVECSDVR